MPISPTFTAEIFKERSTDTDIELITISHSSWDDDIRLCTVAKELLSISDDLHRPIYGVVSRGKEYMYAGIGCIWPNSNADSPPEARFTFSNITPEISEKLEMVDKVYPKVTLELVSYNTPDVVEIERPELILNSANWNLESGSVSVGHYMASGEPCPPYRFTKANFPNLFAE